MSFRVNAATHAAVSASISTPVRARGSTSAGRDGSGSRPGELEVDAIERQRMAERDELGGPLGGADAGQSRGDERVTLRTARVHELGQHLGPHAHGGRSHRPARGHRLVADVDHARRAFVVEMARLHRSHAGRGPIAS